MTLPTGTITMNDVNIELGRASGALITLNDTDVRTLAGKSSGTISMNDLRGKSNAPSGEFFETWQGPANAGITSDQPIESLNFLMGSAFPWQKVWETGTNYAWRVRYLSSGASADNLISSSQTSLKSAVIWTNVYGPSGHITSVHKPISSISSNTQDQENYGFVFLCNTATGGQNTGKGVVIHNNYSSNWRITEWDSGTFYNAVNFGSFVYKDAQAIRIRYSLDLGYCDIKVWRTSVAEPSAYSLTNYTFSRSYAGNGNHPGFYRGRWGQRLNRGIYYWLRFNSNFNSNPSSQPYTSSNGNTTDAPVYP